MQLSEQNKKCAEKHLSGKKSLIRLFAFLCFLCARRKENRKKKIEKREKSPQGNVANTGVPQLG